MSSSSRVRRPHLDRTEPQRSFVGLFVAPGEPAVAAPEPAPAPNQEPTSPGGSAEPTPYGSTPRASADDVADGVGIGYRLIEEYLRQGQQAAHTIWPANAPSFGGGSNVGPERLLEYTTQVAGLWFEQMRNAFNARPPQAAAEPPGGFSYVTPKAERPSNTGTPPANAGMRGPWAPVVVLCVDARRPIEVSLDLHADCQGRELAVFDLRMGNGDGPRIEQVTATWLDERRIRLGLRIGETHPAGAYASVVVDAASNMPVGTLSLQILAH